MFIFIIIIILINGERLWRLQKTFTPLEGTGLTYQAILIKIRRGTSSSVMWKSEFITSAASTWKYFSFWVKRKELTENLIRYIL